MSLLLFAGWPGARFNLSIKKSGIKKNNIKKEINFNFKLGKIKWPKSLFLKKLNFTKIKLKLVQIKSKFLGNSLKILEALCILVSFCEFILEKKSGVSQPNICCPQDISSKKDSTKESPKTEEKKQATA